MARLAEAKAPWERAQAEAQSAQAEAVEDLVGSAIQLGEVARTARDVEEELRNLCAANAGVAQYLFEFEALLK